jgi:hypothetical protein
MAGYRASELVRLDMLINGDPVDAFSVIIHRDKAYEWGRKVAEKLKELIPPPAVPGHHSGGDRQQDHRPRDDLGTPQGRPGQVLRRRHHA